MNKSGLFSAGCVLLLISACAPLFSDLQDARLVGKGQFELTPGYTSAGFIYNGSAEGISNFLGVQAAYGLSDNVDFRFRFEHMWMKPSLSEGGGETMSTNLMAIGPKVNLSRDRAALFLPVVFGRGMLALQPTVLVTVPLVRGKIDFNPSVKHIINICDVCWEPLIALNAGFAFSSNIRKWAIRPEYAVLYNLDDPNGHYFNFSIGVSFNMTALKSN